MESVRFISVVDDPRLLTTAATMTEEIKDAEILSVGDRRLRRRGESGRVGSPKSFPSPSSSSSSDFEFAVSLSPASRQTGGGGSARFCPADELFYKGQLLPLQLSPRISMVRTLLLASSSTSSSSDVATTASPRDSNGSTSSTSSSSSFSGDLPLTVECDSSSSSRRPSLVAEDFAPPLLPINSSPHPKRRFASLATRFSTVWFGRKRSGAQPQQHYASSAATASPSSAAKEILKKCVSKVKPLYERLQSPLQQKHTTSVSVSHVHPLQNPNNIKKKIYNKKKGMMAFSFSSRKECNFPCNHAEQDDGDGVDLTSGNYRMHSLSFSGNLGRSSRKRRTKSAGSCPCSMRSSPSHSGFLYGGMCEEPAMVYSSSSSSSMEELQTAIQGAIAHCKSTILAHSSLKKIV